MDVEISMLDSFSEKVDYYKEPQRKSGERMIRTAGLSKIYRTDEVETTAIENINLSISCGEYVAVMGPSGSGKTTLLNILGLLDNPSSGEYFFMGEEVSTLSERELADLRKGNIGFVFQSFNLIDELTVFENIELPLVYMRLPTARRKAMIEDALEKMQMVHRRNHFPQQLSGGQQQRVALARAIVGNPKLILADEPTGNLASKQGDDVMRLFAELNKSGIAIILITHQAEYAAQAQRVLNISDGRIRTEDFTKESIHV